MSTHAVWSRPQGCNAVHVADGILTLPTAQQRKKALVLDMENQVSSHLSNMSSYLSFVVLQTLETLVITLFSFTKPPFCPRYVLVMAHKFCEGTEVNIEVGN